MQLHLQVPDSDAVDHDLRNPWNGALASCYVTHGCLVLGSRAVNSLAVSNMESRDATALQMTKIPAKPHEIQQRLYSPVIAEKNHFRRRSVSGKYVVEAQIYTAKDYKLRDEVILAASLLETNRTPSSAMSQRR